MELDGHGVHTEDVMPLALTNYGHFTSMRVEADGTVRGFALHLQRLSADCQETFAVDLDLDRVRQWIRQVIDRTAGPLALRVTVYDPELTMGTIGISAHPHVLVTSTPAGTMHLQPLRVKTYPFTRDAPHVKHTGLWSQMQRRRLARLAGYDDALFTEQDHSVSEGATWTAGFIDSSDRIVWPKAPTLPSTTVQLLQTLHESATDVLTLRDIQSMPAAFASNVSIGVRPISQIDEQKFDWNHRMLEVLQDSYRSIPGEVV